MNRRTTTPIVLAIIVSLFALTSITTTVQAVRPNGESFYITFEGGSTSAGKNEWTDKNGNGHIRVMAVEGATIVDCSISEMIGGTLEAIEHADLYTSFTMHMWGRGRITLTGEEKPSYQIQFWMTFTSTGEISGSFKIKGRGEHIEGTDITTTGPTTTLSGTYWHN